MTEWREIAGCANGKRYRVSDDGRVERYLTTSRRWRQIVGWITKNGYRQVTLNKDGRLGAYMVSRLVYESFVGPVPDDMAIDHIDFDRLNNSPKNLRIVTHKENVLHSARSLRLAKKLTPGAVRAIRELATYNTVDAIASAYDVTPSTVRGIVKRESWSWLT